MEPFAATSGPITETSGPITEGIDPNISVTIALILVALIFVLPVAAIVAAILSRNLVTFSWSLLLSLGGLLVTFQPSSTATILLAICMQLGGVMVGIAGIQSRKRAALGGKNSFLSPHEVSGARRYIFGHRRDPSKWRLSQRASTETRRDTAA